MPDGGAQPVQVDLRGRVPALVLGFGIDDQALGAGAGRARGGGGLADRVGAVHVLPGAHVQALGAQRRHEPAVELRPRPHSVGSLDDERPHPGGVRVRGDRCYPAPVGPAQVPDPHGPAVRRPRRGPGRRETEPEHERRGHQPKAQGHVVDASPTRRRFEDRQGRLQRRGPLPAAVAAEPRGLDRHAGAAARLLTPRRPPRRPSGCRRGRGTPRRRRAARAGSLGRRRRRPRRRRPRRCRCCRGSACQAATAWPLLARATVGTIWPPAPELGQWHRLAPWPPRVRGPSAPKATWDQWRRLA